MNITQLHLGFVKMPYVMMEEGVVTAASLRLMWYKHSVGVFGLSAVTGGGSKRDLLAEAVPLVSLLKNFWA